MSDSDRLLVDLVRRRDEGAWQELINRYAGRLMAFVESRLRDRQASEDVVQETFIGFLVSLPNYDDRRDLEAYLFTIASHKLTDHLRRQGRRPISQFGSDEHGRPLDEVPGGIRPASSAARSHERREEEARCLADALSLIIVDWLGKGDYDRLMCAELLIVRGWANKDTAKYLGLTEQAVASYKFQLVTKLKETARKAGLGLSSWGRG